MTDAEFFDAVDAFVNLANELNNKMDTSDVSSAILYAAARYNAFNYFATDGSPENELPTLKGYSSQYEALLQKNMQELRKEFDQANSQPN